jgi:AraC-like DNA-binding protein
MFAESVDYWRDSSLGGIDLIRAEFCGHRFAPHAHSEYVISIYESGAQAFVADGVAHVARAGSSVLLPPCIEHNGESHGAAGFGYRAFYPSAAIVEEIGQGLASAETRQVVVNTSRNLFHLMLAAHRTFEQGSSLVEKEGVLVSALQSFFAAMPTAAVPAAGEPVVASRKLRMARDYVAANFADQQLSIGTIAKQVVLSSAHLMRQFRQAYGLHIHAYVTQLRLENARLMLLDGVSAASAASAVGFVDQSHLIRRFRQFFGATPGRYVRDSVRKR